MATTREVSNKADLWKSAWDAVFKGERFLKTAVGSLYLIALGFSGLGQVGTLASRATQIGKLAGNLRYAALASFVFKDLGDLKDGTLLSKANDKLTNTQNGYYFIVDIATLLLFLHDKVPGVDLTQLGKKTAWRTCATFWLAGSSIGMVRAVDKSLKDSEKSDQSIAKRLCNRDVIVAGADLTYCGLVVGGAPQGTSNAAACVGGLDLWRKSNV